VQVLRERLRVQARDQRLPLLWASQAKPISKRVNIWGERCYIIWSRSLLTYSDTPEGRSNMSVLIHQFEPCTYAA